MRILSFAAALFISSTSLASTKTLLTCVQELPNGTQGYKLEIQGQANLKIATLKVGPREKIINLFYVVDLSGVGSAFVGSNEKTKTELEMMVVAHPAKNKFVHGFLGKIKHVQYIQPQNSQLITIKDVSVVCKQ